MIKKGSFDDLKENQEELQNLKDHRQMVRYAYGGEYAKKQLVRFLFSTKMFDRIETKEDAIRHNLAIDILEDGGFLDQTSVEDAISDYLETCPLLDNKMLES